MDKSKRILDTYLYDDIKDFELYSKKEMNNSFKSGWAMARLTLDNFELKELKENEHGIKA